MSVSRRSPLFPGLVMSVAPAVAWLCVNPSIAKAQDPAAAEPPPVTVPEGAAPSRPPADAPPAPPAAEAPLHLAAAPEVPVVSAREPAVPDWLRSLSIGGGAILWYYAPVSTGAKQNVDLFFANLILDGHFGAVGLHVEPRFRDSRLRAFYPGPVWAQEAYASVTLAKNTVIKAGKAYSRFGLFWDNSFYGNVQVYDGLKLDPDYGLSLEGAVAPNGDKGIRYFAQYFVIDGHTNVSLDGRDTIGVPGGNRRNESILRLEPFIKATDAVTVTGGASGAFLQAALPIGTKNVYRAAVDASLAVKRWGAWAEYTYQNGQTVTDFPIAGTPATATAPAIAGHASAHNHYGLLGSQYSWRAVTVRYNVSAGRYSDVSVTEWMHVPALAVAVGDNLTVLGEYVDWRRYAPAGQSIVDRSVDVTLNGHF